MITIPLGPAPVRIVILLALMGGLSVLGLGVIRSAVGDSVLTIVPRNPDLSVESQIGWADLALKYSPRDPLTHLRRGGVYLKAANEEMDESRIGAAIDEFREAARMSPEDYRAWLALGRALDRGEGDTAEARKAFERAIELAPNHFDPHWFFGNYLLRGAGDRDGSFAQMRLALVNRPSALPLVFNYAWDVYRGDGKAIIAALDPSKVKAKVKAKVEARAEAKVEAGVEGAEGLARQIKSQLATLLIYRGRVDDGMGVWRDLTTPTAVDAQRVTEALFNTGNFNKAYEVWNSVEIPNRPAHDWDSLLSNGGFEGDLARDQKTPFLTWKVTPVPGAKILRDRKEPREGRYSLRAGFDVRGNAVFTIASQTVPAKPSTNYRLTFSIRSDKLMSLSNPLIEVFDSAYSLGQKTRVRVATQPLPNGDIEWTDDKLEFTTNPQTEALTVRILRPPCPEPPCPIEGHIWFDEFKLQEKNEKRRKE
jgi:tetratricopeptide (TPR) repeat protein